MPRRTAIPFPTSLWDLLRPRSARRKPPPPPKPAPARRPKPAGAMQQRYESITRDMLKHHGVRVRKWRTGMSGVAWQVTYQDGSVSRLIEAPRPKGPMSAAIFLHEIGHHAIGFGTYKPRCLEEYHAWKFAIDTMHELGLNVTDRVHTRMRESLQYAVAKARRRGLKRIPSELLPFLDVHARG
ncbi:MAG: hypothetical protein H6810_12260 [Phycisphaeraceae bacterium]|nr:MAG: hypothetical protein H6810_12260 [Phycisphaeraceae bacterium]